MLRLGTGGEKDDLELKAYETTNDILPNKSGPPPAAHRSSWEPLEYKMRVVPYRKPFQTFRHLFVSNCRRQAWEPREYMAVFSSPIRTLFSTFTTSFNNSCLRHLTSCIFCKIGISCFKLVETEFSCVTRQILATWSWPAHTPAFRFSTLDPSQRVTLSWFLNVSSCQIITYQFANLGSMKITRRSWMNSLTNNLVNVLPIAKKTAVARGLENYNILQNNGRIAHQVFSSFPNALTLTLLQTKVVDHVHFHIIPKPSESDKEGLVIGWPTKEGLRMNSSNCTKNCRASYRSHNGKSGTPMYL